MPGMRQHYVTPVFSPTPKLDLLVVCTLFDIDPTSDTVNLARGEIMAEVWRDCNAEIQYARPTTLEMRG